MSAERDNVMARLGAAAALASEAAELFRQAIVIFAAGAAESDGEGGDDFDGTERLGLIESGESSLRDAAVAAQRAVEGFESLSKDDLRAEEDADDDEDDDASDEEG